MDANQIMAEAARRLARGAFAEAELLSRRALEQAPNHFPAAMLLGDLRLKAGKIDDALAAYQIAAKAMPGHALPFTRDALLRFRRRFGNAPAARQPVGGVRRLQMTTLGANGRFGNQLLQYAFVRLYANEHGLTPELPDWIGRDLFGLDDPFLSVRLKTLDESQADFFASLNRRTPQVLADLDISGYFCGPTREWANRRHEFRALFTPGPKIAPSLATALSKLHTAGQTIVALHLRRGDFGQGRFWIAPSAWYLAWLDQIWSRLATPVLYVATDDLATLSDFARFDPWSAEKLAIDLPGAEFMIDHHVLRSADHLAISNSTFSFTAAMLNEHASSFVRPDQTRQELMPFDPWDADVLLAPGS